MIYMIYMIRDGSSMMIFRIESMAKWMGVVLMAFIRCFK